MSILRRSLVALTTSLALLLTGVTTALATPAKAPDPAMAAALARIATGTQSATDLALVKTDPELAKVVADPTRTKVTTTTSPSLAKKTAPGDALIMGEEICGNWIEVTVTVSTVLGFTLFQWKHHAGFCIDLQAVKVTRWENRYDQMMYADPTIEVKELTANQATPLPSSVGYSTMQRHLQQCVLTYGCWANWYPWAQIGIAGNGQWGWSWGVG